MSPRPTWAIERELVSKYKQKLGWTDGSTVKSRGLEFNSQHPHGSSQPSLTPFLGDLTHFSGLYSGTHAYGAHTYMQAKHSDT